MAKLPQTVMLRAQEIAATATDPITADDCLFRAVTEFYRGDFDGVVRALVTQAGSAFRNAIERDQDLPDDGADPTESVQGRLFDTRSYIVVDTPDAERLIVPKEHQTLGHVRAWTRQQRSRHRVQATRFDRALEDLDAYAGELSDEDLWLDVRPQLQKAKTEALTEGRDDAT